MTSLSNTFIDNYIQRLTELNQSPERIPSVAELKKLAADLGINPEEIEAAQKKSQAHLTRAQGYMQLKHWDDAIEELIEAIALCPYNEDLVLSLANAHLERWCQHHRRDDAENVRLRVKDCLFLQPNSEAALKLLAKFDKARQQHRTFWIRLLVGMGSLITLSSLFWAYPESVNYSWSKLWHREDKIEQLEQRLLAEIQGLREEQEQLRKELQSAQTTETMRYRDRLTQLDKSLKQLQRAQQAWDYQFHKRRFRQWRRDSQNER